LAFDNVPWPDEFAMPLVNVVPPSAKLKAPEPVPPKGPVKVAVRVTAALTSAGLADELSWIEGVARFTTCAALSTRGANVPSPE
jgi:hypothetical protein